MRSLIEQKRGQGMAVLGFLLLGVTFVIVMYLVAIPLADVWDKTSDELKGDGGFGNDKYTTDGSNSGNISIEKLEQMDGMMTPLFDQIVFFSFVAVILITLIIAVFTDVHPVFLVFLGIGVIVIAIIASQLINVSEDTMSNPQFINKTAEFTFSNVVVGTGLPLVIIMVGAVAIIIMMSRKAGGGA